MELPEQFKESLQEIISQKGNKTAVGIKTKKIWKILRAANKAYR